MNIFKIHKGYRKIGINYGLPVFYIDIGPGVGYEPTNVIRKLGSLGFDKGDWVVIRNNALRERGIGVLVSGLKFVGARVEFEDDGTSVTPGWFPEVDRWVVDYRDNAVFNYNALRPRQDMLICNGNDLGDFLERTKSLQALRAIVVDDMDAVWDIVKNSNVRVYRKEGRLKDEM